jgi:nicotinamide riboside transporter PnuC
MFGMKLFPNLHKVVQPPGSGAAIRAGEHARHDDSHNRARFFLVLFMRLLAGLWVAQGLLQWATILLPREPLFDKLPAVSGAAVIFFAVFDVIAAAGLWLATPWGGVIWLLSAIAQIVVALALPGSFSVLWIAANIVLITIYFYLTWRAGHAGPVYVRARQSRSKS